MCKHEERADAECTVNVEIDFKNRVVTGLLYMNKRNSIATLRLETKFQHEINSIKTTVWYTCTMSDYCDQDFLNELLTDKLAEFNVTSVQEKLINLLYISNTTEIQCVNGTCPSNSFCQAKFDNLVISNYNYTSIDGHLPCVNLSSTDYFLKFHQDFFPFETEASEMSVRCNIDECNSNSTIKEVYALLRHDFVLPLNYSILNINTTYPSTASTLISFYSLIIFSSLFSLNK
jgi:hypothetical protein